MMQKSLKKVLALFLSLTPIVSVVNAAQVPTVDFEHALNTYFDDESALVSFQDTRFIFAPEGKLNATISILNAGGRTLKTYKHYPDYKTKNGVYARAMVQTPADFTTNDPGDYTIVYSVNNQPVTHLPFRIELKASNPDPFNPQKKYTFNGPWTKFGLLTKIENPDDNTRFHFWVGGRDLPEGKRNDGLIVTLYRDKKMVAHTKRKALTEGINLGHFRQTTLFLFHPHEVKKEPNARIFKLKDWLVDGRYELQITRQSDNKLVRSFDFKVSGKKFEPHPRTVSGYKPQTNYIAPRVQKKDTTILELEKAYWIEDRDL